MGPVSLGPAVQDLLQLIFGGNILSFNLTSRRTGYTESNWCSKGKKPVKPLCTNFREGWSLTPSEVDAIIWKLVKNLKDK